MISSCVLKTMPQCGTSTFHFNRHCSNTRSSISSDSLPKSFSNHHGLRELSHFILKSNFTSNPLRIDRCFSFRRQKCSRHSGLVQVTASKRKEVKIKVLIRHQVKFGEQIAIAGSAKWLGNWKDLQNMSWSEEGWWREIPAVAGEAAEFKFVIIKDGSVLWEDGPNRSLTIPESTENSFSLETNWDETSEELNLILFGSGGSIVEVGKSGFEKKQVNANDARDGLEENSFVSGWQGKEISFMRSNEHSGNRSNWNLDGLEGTVLELVRKDQHAGNWWRKLEVVREILTRQESGDDRLDALIYSAIYLQWINSGQIACVEDGGHHRPNRHADISSKIFRYLEQIIAKKDISSQESIVIRKIHPRLPSFTAEFTASVPLTRIRDIAHRNDIPHDLKQEIKHTIQNKLHRNAGPEDLVATEAMLRKVTEKKGQYSESFIEQLSIFYKELKDFFNASTLTEQLDSLRASLDETKISVLESFLAAKRRVDNSSSVAENATRVNQQDTDAVIGCLHALTGVRAILLDGLFSGLRNDASDESIAMRQKWRLSEIGLEDYSFVLLSRFVNIIESGGGAKFLSESLKSRNVASWHHPIGATVLGLRQIGLSGFMQSECVAIENELTAWQNQGLGSVVGVISDEDIRIWSLRMKASISRARRLADSYTEILLKLYSESSQKLGKSMYIPENTVNTFAESEIRSSVVFQLSKLCSLLLKALRMVSGGESFDIIMSGDVVGKLVQVDKIIPGCISEHASNKPIILLVKEADGDEEVKTAGDNVVGIILCQELPHLSHLGVRARQEGVPFVTCEDEEKIMDLKSLVDRPIRLTCTSEKADVAAFGGILPKIKIQSTNSDSNLNSNSNSKPNQKFFEEENGMKVFYDLTAPYFSNNVVKKGIHDVLDVLDAELAVTGAKASACGQLSRLSRITINAELEASEMHSCQLFYTPRGVCIPYGAMEDCLKSNGSYERFSYLLNLIDDKAVTGNQLDEICDEIQHCISQLRLPDQTIDDVEKSFTPETRLIARSSANVEDLAGMSGAGLFDSVANIQTQNKDEFTKAITQVWGSLYTRRAVLSRRLSGVLQKDADMAILIQELLSPNLSFVLHTRNLVSEDEDILTAEIAAGLGETLARGTRGSPWRFAITKAKDINECKLAVLSFANFSNALFVSASSEANGEVLDRVVDYSKEELSTVTEARYRLGKKLVAIGMYLECHFGCAQDIEGCVVGDKVYIVQTRPQP